MNTEAGNNFSVVSSTINVGGQCLHYIKMGGGDKLVLCFHGYANDASMFQFLVHSDFTVLSFDLPFQGQSAGEKDAILSKNDVAQMVLQLMAEYKVSKIGLVGFSLGARVCLCITEQLPDLIRNMVLIAPDGVRHNYFYQSLTGTAIGRSAFRGFIKFGNSYLHLFSVLHRLGVLDRHMYTFALQYIRTHSSRELLLNIWMTTSKLIPRLRRVKSFIMRHSIPVHILMGRDDKVIPLKNALKFKGKNPFIQIHVFDRGHNLLDFDEVKGTLAAWLFRVYQPVHSI